MRETAKRLVAIGALLGTAALVAVSPSTAAQFKGRIAGKPPATTGAKERLNFRITKDRRRIKRMSIRSVAGRCIDPVEPEQAGTPRTAFTEPVPIAFPFAWWGAEESGFLRIEGPIPVGRNGSFRLRYSARLLPFDYDGDGDVDRRDFRRVSIHVLGRITTPREAATGKVRTGREAATGRARARVTTRAGRTVCDSYGYRRWKARRVR